MKVVGLTGGVGMGKSTCSDLLRQQAIPVVDTDELAREVVQPGSEALELIQKEFGSRVLDQSGALRRSTLAHIVFSEPAARQKLEGILHPRIRQLWKAQAAKWKTQGSAVGFVVIPLLFETKAEQELDRTVCLACSARTQHLRLKARGWSNDQIHQRIAAQLPVENKITRSNYMLWNEASVEVLQAQLQRVLRSVSSIP